IEEIRKKKIDVCQGIIIALSDGEKHLENKQQIIEAGVVDALLHIFSSQPLESITLSHIWAFFVFTHPSSSEIELLLAEKNPYPALIRLLDHQVISVVSKTTNAILNILLGRSVTTPVNQPHPYFQTITSCGGIEKLYSLFKKNLSPGTKYSSALSIANLFKAKEIPNVEIRKDLIEYLKSTYKDPNSSSQLIAKFSLKRLAENSVNRTEIEKDGFKIPE
ncbi:MAG: hypothetical protein EZS28_037428, partial [Streblomastix strix]